MLIVWALSVIACVAIAVAKNRSLVGWFFLGLLLGPIAVILAVLSPKIEKTGAIKVSDVDTSGDLSSDALKNQLTALKTEVEYLNRRLGILSEKIALLTPENMPPAEEKIEPPVAEPLPAVEPLSAAEPFPPAQSKATSAQQPDIETDLGKFWLNKIGIIVFSLGVAFLLTYAFAHVGPLAKIIFGYLIAVGLFTAGAKLEVREKFSNYGRVLLGGAWAIAYFTTYAMYHFEASKILYNQPLELILLAVVALGIIAHSLKYKSESLTGIALFIGYVTSVIGDVAPFTLINAGFLALICLFLVYKMQWIRFIFVGIVLTYLVHFAWVVKQIVASFVPVGTLDVQNVFFLFDAGFLSIYWVLFTAALHLIKPRNDASHLQKLAMANLLNFLLFFFMTYPKFYYFYPHLKFEIVLGLGIVYLVLSILMNLARRPALFVCDVVVGISLLTLSIPLKFMQYQTTVLWLIELPFLLFLGFVLEKRVLRFLSFGLAVMLFLKFLVMSEWTGFLSLFGAFSTAACYILYRFAHASERSEQSLQNCYSGFCVVFVSMYLTQTLNPLWLTFGLSLQSLVLFVCGVLLCDRYIRWYALAVSGIAVSRYFFYDRCDSVTNLPQAVMVLGPICCSFAQYFLYRALDKKQPFGQVERFIKRLVFFAAASQLVFAAVVYMPRMWISLSLAAIAVSALWWGGKIGDIPIRAYSLLVLLMMGLRCAFIDDYAWMSEAVKWFLISAKIAALYVYYFVFRQLRRKAVLQMPEVPVVDLPFYAGTVLLILMISRFIKDIWISVALGIAGVLMFAAGFLLKEKIFRHAGFILFGITLGKIVFIDLSGLPILYKIVSFIIIGILFLGVSFIYTRNSSARK
ncbi:MAG TPA: DUF2339 domain-containing protein [Candidatus Omnitrophota bacterium]|nr:DUF2339 domain-containing protein [Candidatus Omnitrophota bacterium]HRZ14736.1 DUF2339 domain-containing protein [Candidatus Omnitrophota bacterium]